MTFPRFSRVLLPALAFSVLLNPAWADDAAAPAFDRPGIAFSTSTLPPGTLSWEQGLPDLTYDSGDGSRSWIFSADTTLRLGLVKDWELQLAMPLWNYQETRTDGHSSSGRGFGDAGAAVKAALPSPSEKFTWAALGGVTFATGDPAFTAGGPQYALGVTASYAFTGALSGSGYVNLQRFRSESTWTLSPALSYAVNDKTGVYAEAGFDLTNGQGHGTVAGGGITWMLTSAIQLDAGIDFGVSGNAPDVTGGVGFSIFFK